MRSELERATALLQSGDRKDLDAALQLLRTTVLSFGLKVCGDREDAEDTTQEVLIRALPHLAKLEDPHALAAWLYTAAKNRCWQNRRTARYRRTVALDQLFPSDAELNALLLADPAVSPEGQALTRQNHRVLHQAVLTLPADYRIVLVLHDMEELDTDLIAKILAIQRGTVRVRLHRARLLLRQEMAAQRKGAAAASPRRRKSATPRPAQCREIFANLSEYLDNQLEPESCERMRRHIEACPACVAFIRNLKQAIDRCRQLDVCPAAEAGPGLRRLLTEEYLRLKNSSANL